MEMKQVAKRVWPLTPEQKRLHTIAAHLIDDDLGVIREEIIGFLGGFVTEAFEGIKGGHWMDKKVARKAISELLGHAAYRAIRDALEGLFGDHVHVHIPTEQEWERELQAFRKRRKADFKLKDGNQI